MSILSNDDYIVFGKPDIRQEDIDEVVDSLRSGWIGTGPKVKLFEEAFAKYKGVSPDQVAAVNSCTAALHLSLIAAGVGSGDEVITTAMTFCSSVNAIIHVGATPILVDIKPDTYNIDPEEIVKRISSKTKAILPVHFAGYPCEMDTIVDIAKAHGLKIIEDCAHAIETEYKGQKAGTIGDFGCFSFYATKNLTTGEGGMVIAKDPNTISRIRSLALHGLSRDAWKRYSDDGYKHYEVAEVGFKYNMIDIQAALGIHQLKRVEENLQRRIDLFKYYQNSFKSLPIQTPCEAPRNIRPAHHLYPILVATNGLMIDRDQCMHQLHVKGIGTGVHYQNILEHELYKNRCKAGSLPIAASVGGNTLSLPMSPLITVAQRKRIVDVVTGTLKV